MPRLTGTSQCVKQVLGGGQIRQGKLLDFAKPNSQVWKNIAVAKVVMKGQPSNFKVKSLPFSKSGSFTFEVKFRTGRKHCI